MSGNSEEDIERRRQLARQKELEARQERIDLGEENDIDFIGFLGE